MNLVYRKGTDDKISSAYIISGWDYNTQPRNIYIQHDYGAYHYRHKFYNLILHDYRKE